MELNKFKKDLKYLKQGEKLMLGYFIFYVLGNEYHVYDTEKKKDVDVYKKKDWLLICNDFRYSIEKHSDKKPIGSTWNFHGGGWE
jgi:hypothetical protein